MTLIDRLPHLTRALDGGVIPLLGRLDQVGPDLNQLLGSVSQVNHMISRLPKVFRRRSDGGLRSLPGTENADRPVPAAAPDARMAPAFPGRKAR